jgi:hypothetical protein
MSDFEKNKLEMEFRSFTARNFEKPADCKNLDQVRFYVNELCQKIEEYNMHFNYVPGWAYSLLAQYNARQNSFLHNEFKESYFKG